MATRRMPTDRNSLQSRRDQAQQDAARTTPAATTGGPLGGGGRFRPIGLPDSPGTGDADGQLPDVRRRDTAPDFQLPNLDDYFGGMMDEFQKPVDVGMTPEELARSKEQTSVAARSQALRDVGSMAAGNGGSLDDPALINAAINTTAAAGGEAARAGNALDIENRKVIGDAEFQRRSQALGLGSAAGNLALGFGGLAAEGDRFWGGLDFQREENNADRAFRERTYEDSRTDRTREKTSSRAADLRREAMARLARIEQEAALPGRGGDGMDPQALEALTNINPQFDRTRNSLARTLAQRLGLPTGTVEPYNQGLKLGGITVYN